MNRNKSPAEMPSLPIPPERIGSRVGAACDLVGTRREVAERLEISVSTLMRYIKEDGVPIPSDFVVRLASAAGVRVEWLLLCKGPMREEEWPLDSGVRGLDSGGGAQREALAHKKEEPAQEHPAKRYDRDLLMEVVIALEEFFEEEGMQPTPERRAKLTALLYEISIIREHIARDEMKSLLKVAA